MAPVARTASTGEGGMGDLVLFARLPPHGKEPELSAGLRITSWTFLRIATGLSPVSLRYPSGLCEGKNHGRGDQRELRPRPTHPQFAVARTRNKDPDVGFSPAR